MKPAVHKQAAFVDILPMPARNQPEAR